ncbi:NAD(P)H-dependent glycerol-3-phosphate dehydrogenase [Shimazuella sp. AN120528]|uniref:NAD(P)H-dependent glycerol-3-phosphate dehydrogenase n=1 Tax=Shimazuella soli TaxID=1892854 RepID=UPI001F0D2434|nr:NAD(P)H-dependent glycerol-3-phosphate dehydrogenase [Shimazuella soli]MCH5586466.1 NAD(P)H-dependent glycerol-3-phosphate dehydrogenase [Shimazuella soli]
MKRIAVIGAGSWGTVLANVLVDNGHEVTIWARKEEVSNEINNVHRNRAYLGEAELHLHLKADTSLKNVVFNKEVVLFAVPSHAMREMLTQVKPYVHSDALLIHATKGFEQESWKRMSELIAEELPQWGERIVVLSGPSHAEEVIKRSPTTVVVASSCQHSAELTQTIFINSYFRVYTNPDVVGVEIGGALKNIIALATGLADGLGYGDNARAALMTRGLAEIARVGTAMGAEAITFVGLAGVGDLIGTCTSKHSRNWRAGYAISQGKSLTEVLSEMKMVVEGVKTTRAGHALKEKYNIEMPITEQLYAVLFQGKDPKIAVEDLMSRGKTRELQEMAQGW